MFKYPCFIRKNTPELREKLHRLGGRNGTILDNIMDLTVAYPTFYRCLDDEGGNADKLIANGFYDCGTNEDLFLALAAVRDDTDKGQWFVCGMDTEFILCTQSELKNMIDNEYDFEDKYSVSDCHKATKDELIKHFTK